VVKEVKLSLPLLRAIF